MNKLIEKLEDDEDVSNVYTNMVPDPNEEEEEE